MSYRLFTNARFLTPNGDFEDAALLVGDGRIAARVPGPAAGETVGRDGVERVDLGGRWVVPGFVDAHIHLRAVALKRLRSDLAPARSAGDVVARLREHAGRTGGAVVGVDWDETHWADAGTPTRDALDAISRTRPVLARRVCGHVAVANTALLALLGDVVPAFVDAATGRIVETAVERANRVCDPPAEETIPAFEDAIGELHALGITGIHDIVGVSTLDGYLAGVARARAPLHIDALFVATPAEFEDLRARCRREAPRLRAAGIKLFSDGSIGGHTAAVNEAYADAPTRGELLVEPDALRATLGACAQRGIACAVHAIGDRAVGMVAGAMAGVDGGGRFRIEHAELIGERELEAVAACGAVLVMQPNFVRNWAAPGALYETRLGERRWRNLNRFATLERRGVDFVFSSDGMPPGPLFGLVGATRHPVPGESITPASALRRYTEGPCRMAGHRRPGGRLEPGAPADLAVLDGDPLSAPADGAADAADRAPRVVATVVGGETVFGPQVG